jgi:hypothetical protein
VAALAITLFHSAQNNLEFFSAAMSTLASSVSPYRHSAAAFSTSAAEISPCFSS